MEHERRIKDVHEWIKSPPMDAENVKEKDNT